MAHAAAFRAYTDAEIETALTNWKAALEAIRLSKSYSIGGRQLTRADENFILDTLGSFQEEKERRDGSGPSRVTYADMGGRL
jgi:hypothetical protein